MSGEGASEGVWSVLLALVNLGQTVLLAWIASRGARRRASDRRATKRRHH